LQKDFEEMGLCGMDSIDLAQDRGRWRAFVNTAMNLRVQLNAEKFLSRFTSGSCWRKARFHEVGEEKAFYFNETAATDLAHDYRRSLHIHTTYRSESR
jgi:hypothetical protein